MKLVKKETNLKLVSVDSENYGRSYGGFNYGLDFGIIKYKYTFESNKCYDSKKLSVMIEEEEAETLKEFRELNGLEKSDLVEFLNKNYK